MGTPPTCWLLFVTLYAPCSAIDATCTRLSVSLRKCRLAPGLLVCLTISRSLGRFPELRHGTILDFACHNLADRTMRLLDCLVSNKGCGNIAKANVDCSIQLWKN